MRKLGKMLPLLIADKAIGRTALNKLAFFADVVHLIEHGSTISDEPYLKLTHGPVPREMTMIRQSLVVKGILDEEVDDDGLNCRYTYRVTPDGKAMATDLPETALAVIRRVHERLSDETAAKLSQKSHEFEPWKSQRYSEVLDLSRVLGDEALHKWLATKRLLN